jgi:phosphohistidine phosphatase
MFLYVMRHGPAEDRGPTGRDFDRRLTDDGRSIVERAASELLRHRGSRVARVLSSPRVRAAQTAEIVRRLAGPPGGAIELRDELAEEDPPLDLVHEVATAGADALLVGHQPTVELLVRSLVPAGLDASRGSPLAPGFSTAMIAVLTPRGALGQGYQLDQVLDPRRPLGSP